MAGLEEDIYTQAEAEELLGLSQEINDPEEPWPWRKHKSMYVRIFEDMISTVLVKEYFLFLPEEVDVLERMENLSYAAKFLVIKLSLRKEGKWHRLDKLITSYTQNLAEEDVTRAFLEISGPSESVNSPSRGPEVMDLTLSDDDEDEQNGSSSKHTLSSTHSLSSPSSTQMPSNGTPGTKELTEADLSILAFNEGHATSDEVMSCLCVEELKSICKQAKVNKSQPTRGQLLSNLKTNATNQSVLTSFYSDRRSSKGKRHDQTDRLRAMALKTIRGCIKINPAVVQLIRRLDMISLRSTQILPLMQSSVLSYARKRNYPWYKHVRSNDIFISREAFLQYEDALQLEVQLEQILEGTLVANGKQGQRSKSLPQKTKRERNDEDDEDEHTMPELVQSPRLAQARAAKDIWQKVWEKWKMRIGEIGREQPRLHGLERFDSMHIYTRLVAKGAEALGLLKEYSLEVEVLRKLLSQTRYRRGRRGQWYDRLALILMNHCGKTPEKLNDALEVTIRGLEDPLTHIVYRASLKRRVARLEKKLQVAPERQYLAAGGLRVCEDTVISGRRVFAKAPSVGLDKTARVVNAASDLQRPSIIQMLLSPMRCTSVGGVTINVAAETSEASTELKKSTDQPWTGKSIWKGSEGEDINVETLAIQHYNRKGYKGFHCEGSMLGMIYSLLFWDILFTHVPGAFETPYQNAPLDIAEDTFYFSRKNAVDVRLNDIRSGKAAQLLQDTDNRERTEQTFCIGVHWDKYEEQDLVEAVTCIGGEVLAVICQTLCEDYDNRRSGVPDLFVWDISKKISRFVEVKGPGDTLRENQKVWIDVLLGAGAVVEVCHVVEEGTAKRPKKGKRKERANTEIPRVVLHQPDSEDVMEIVIPGPAPKRPKAQA